MSPFRGGGRCFSFLFLPLVLWGLRSPLPSSYLLLGVEGRTYLPGEKVLLLEGVPYRLWVILKGGLIALGEAPARYKGSRTRALFCQSDGFALKGPWGEGGCFVTKREVKWEGPFQPYRDEKGRYTLLVPWDGRWDLGVEVRKEWLCDIRTSAGTRIQRLKEKARRVFHVQVLEAREAWYRSLYITAWGVEDRKLREELEHLSFLMRLLEKQVLRRQGGMVRLNLLAWREARKDLESRLEALEEEGNPVGVWVRLLPSWRAWPRIRRLEEVVKASRACWETSLRFLGLEVRGPLAPFPFPLLSWDLEALTSVGPSPLAPSLFAIGESCWRRWCRGVGRLVPRRDLAVEVDRVTKEGLGKGGPWELGWVPWNSEK